MEPDPQEPAAPSVLAVVVAHDPGPWFDETLVSLALQDYPSLRVLVLNTGDRDVTERVREVLPSAHVQQVLGNPGFGAAANRALQVPDRPTFFVFCHDDVALDATAVRAMVEEAYRSNGAVIGPKLVEWDRPDHLLAVGLGADKFGVGAPYVERGELDQSQHDAVREVFMVPGGCALVRADLFEALGGFEPAVDFLGEHLDLCWRAHSAGARVLVAPAARVRHQEALAGRMPVADRRRRWARHRLRAVLTCYRPLSLALVLPQAVLVTAFQIIGGLVRLRPGEARVAAGAWGWNLARLPSILRSRARLRRLRQVPDRDVRRLQVRGSALLSAALRDRLEGERPAGAATRVVRSGLERGPRRDAIATVSLVALVLAFGSRHLITRGVPAIGEMGGWPDSSVDLLRGYLTGWRTVGLGSAGALPTLDAVVGVLDSVAVGFSGLLRVAAILGLLPVGLVGMWRLIGATGSVRGRAVGVLLYAAVPVPYNALATGSWRALALYALVPWLVARLSYAGGIAPFGPPRPWLRSVIGLGVLLALAASVAPATIPIVVFVSAALAVGSVLVGDLGGAARSTSAVLAGAVVALVLQLPWALTLGSWDVIVGSRPPGPGDIGFGELLRFHTGPTGATVLTYGVVLAAALPILIGRDWRLAWAVRGWSVAVACWALVWADQEGWLPFGLPAAEVVLAPGAAGLAIAGAMGMVAFEEDLRGYHFGWRQFVSVAGAIAGVAGALAIVGASIGGRWQMPRGDYVRTFAFAEEERRDGAYRVLWIGHPAVLPLAGWDLGDDLVFGLSDQGRLDVRDISVPAIDDGSAALRDELRRALEGRTARLGRELAPMGVKYVVLADQIAPAPYGGLRKPMPAAVEASMAEQLDLEEVQLNPALQVYRNAAWLPSRIAAEADELPDPGELVPEDLTAPDAPPVEPVLTDEERPGRYIGGEIDSSDVVYVATGADERLELRVGDGVADREDAAWANVYSADRDGETILSYRTPSGHLFAVGGQLVAWMLALGFLVRRTRRRRRDRPATVSVELG